jgi:hypothetical protein
MSVLVFVLETIATRLAALLWADEGQGFAREYRRMEEAMEAEKEAEENGEELQEGGNVLDDGSDTCPGVKLAKSLLLLLCKPLEVVSLALLPLVCRLIGSFIGVGPATNDVLESTHNSTSTAIPPEARPLALALLFESVNAHPEMLRKNRLAGWYLRLADAANASARESKKQRQALDELAKEGAKRDETKKGDMRGGGAHGESE